MNTNLKSRTIGATIVLGVLLGSAACGTETVNENDPGTQPGIEARVYPPASVPPAPLGKSQSRVSADRASTDRWARGTQVENKLQQSGHPTRP